MPIADFSTIDVYHDEAQAELYIPFSQKEIGNFVKTRFNARFKTDGAKKRWVVEYKYAKADIATILSEVEEQLYAIASPDWRKIVEQFVNYACASRRYEVKFSAGGVRIMLPGGHPLHYYLGQMCKEKPERDVWRIPAREVKPRELAPMLVRISEEDRAVFTEATEPYQDRTITGPLLMSWKDSEAFNLVKDAVVFADYAFLQVADPMIVPMQIHAWPFTVVKTEPTEGGIQTTLAYMDAEKGARKVGRLMALPREERPPLLDALHAEQKWKARRV